MTTMRMPEMLARQREIETKLRAAQAEAEAGDGDGSMTAAQQAAFDALYADLVALKAAIQNRARVDEIERTTRGTHLAGRSDSFEVQARSFNLRVAIAHAAGLAVDAGRELEISAELRRRSGRRFEGIAVPLEALHKPIERRVVTPGGTGAGVIGTYLDETLYIDALRAAVVTQRLGARMITGLSTQIDIPRLSATATASWVADGSAIPTDTTQLFDKLSLRPHSLGGLVEFTRNMLLTSTPEIDGLVQADLIQVLARGLDFAVLAGPGGVSPTGILSTAGLAITPINTNGGPITWAAVLALVESVQLGNAPEMGQAFVSNPKVRAQAMGTLRFAGVAAGTVMEAPDAMAGYPFASTTQVPSNGTKGTGTNLSTLIFGSWSEALIGIFGGDGVDILVNPYGNPQYSEGNVQVRAFLSADVAIRHIASFGAISDLAAP